MDRRGGLCDHGYNGLWLVEELLDGLPIEHLVEFEQRIAVDVLGHHDLGLQVEETVHEKLI